jgi:hypothetical protein
MKTMRKGDDVKRVSENQVAEYLKLGYVFCPKKDYKKTGTIK